MPKKCKELPLAKYGESAARVQWLVQEQRVHWKHICSCTAWELLETWQLYQEQLGLVATYFTGILRAKGICGHWNARPRLGLGSSFMCQPRAASLPERGPRGTGAGGFLPPRGALHPICCQCRGVLDHLAGATKEKQAFLKSVWLQEGRPGFGSLQLRDLLLLALGGSSSMRILLLLWQKTKYQQP